MTEWLTGTLLRPPLDPACAAGPRAGAPHVWSSRRVRPVADPCGAAADADADPDGRASDGPRGTPRMFTRQAWRSLCF